MSANPFPFADQFDTSGAQNCQIQIRFAIKFRQSDFLFRQIQLYACQIKFRLHHYHFHLCLIVI